MPTFRVPAAWQEVSSVDSLWQPHASIQSSTDPDQPALWALRVRRQHGLQHMHDLQASVLPGTGHSLAALGESILMFDHRSETLCKADANSRCASQPSASVLAPGSCAGPVRQLLAVASCHNNNQAITGHADGSLRVS